MSNNIDTHASGAKILSALRALSAKSHGTLAAELEASERQARLLGDALPGGPASQVLEQVTDLVAVRTVDDIPLAGISYKTHGRWNIDVRASDPVESQLFTVLHELKHIVDDPQRREHGNLLCDTDWEVLANHFATQVLAHTPSKAAQ